MLQRVHVWVQRVHAHVRACTWTRCVLHETLADVAAIGQLMPGTSGPDLCSNLARMLALQCFCIILFPLLSRSGTFLDGPSPHSICCRNSNKNTVMFGMSTGKLMIAPSFALGSNQCCLQDMGELEAGVGQSVYPLDRLGLPFNILRAFRRLLFLETSEVPTSPLLRELPPSVVLHHLYSRAPAALQSPHVRHNFTPAQVCTMLSMLAVSHNQLLLSHTVENAGGRIGTCCRLAAALF